ncbi:MAG: phage recombination protein Bet [Pseudomonadota bacterium]|nr:phage recombination protein Bet [Pseudomonadota bacterium]
MIPGLTEQEASALARANVCGCGQNLIVTWGDDFSARDYSVHCLVDKEHTALKIKDSTRKLYNGQTKTWEAFDVTTQKPVETGAIVRYQTDHGQMELSVRQIQLYLCPKATEQEAYMFLRLCQAQRLNPFLKEAYLVIFDGEDGRTASMIVGRDAFIRRAEAHEQFGGFRAGIIVELAEGNVEELDGAVPPVGSTLLGGWSIVSRRDRNDPHKTTVSFSEYNTNRRNWKRMPATMIRKVAIVQGLREVFPTVYAGVDANVDIGDADEVMGEVISDSGAPESPTSASQSQERHEPARQPSRSQERRQTAQGAPRSQQQESAPTCPAHNTRMGKHPDLGWVHTLKDGTFCTGQPAAAAGQAAQDASTPSPDDVPTDLPPSQAQDIEGLRDAVASASLDWGDFETRFLRMTIHEWLSSGKTIRQALALVPGYQMPRRQGGG